MFKKNDKVFVREWNEMLADERVKQDHKGDLFEKDKPGNSFVKDMKRYCGSAAIIAEVTDDGGFYLMFHDEEIPLYVFRDWMLEEAEGSVKVIFVGRDDD